MSTHNIIDFWFPTTTYQPFWFDKSYLKMKLIKGVKVNV